MALCVVDFSPTTDDVVSSCRILSLFSFILRAYMVLGVSSLKVCIFGPCICPSSFGIYFISLGSAYLALLILFAHLTMVRFPR